MKKKHPSQAKNVPSTEDPTSLRVVQDPTEKPADALAIAAMQPSVQAAVTLLNYHQDFGVLSVNTMVAELQRLCDQTISGDLSRGEAILTAQAITLDGIFQNLARRAALSMDHNLKSAEIYARLALKAQSQCRTTMESLAEIKNPRSVAFVRQANIANGAQQINNHTDASLRAENSKNPKNKVLEKANEQRLDTGETASSIAASASLETLEPVYGTENIGRQREGF